jgi:hypothetical protein
VFRSAKFPPTKRWRSSLGLAGSIERIRSSLELAWSPQVELALWRSALPDEDPQQGASIGMVMVELLDPKTWTSSWRCPRVLRELRSETPSAIARLIREHEPILVGTRVDVERVEALLKEVGAEVTVARLPQEWSPWRLTRPRSAAQRRLRLEHGRAERWDEG